MKMRHVSNKRIILLSLLSFSSGLFFFGGTNIVHAATVDTTDTASANSNVSADVQNNNNSSNKNSVSNNENDDLTNNSGSQNDDSNGVADTSPTDSTQGQPVSQNITPTAPSPTQAVAQVSSQESVSESSGTENSASLNIPESTAADHQGKLSGDNGSQWYLDNDGTLYFGAGTVDDPNFNDTNTSDDPVENGVWANYKYANDVKSIIFEDGAVAGSDLSYYFYKMANVSSVDVSKLDVSNTSNFEYMFNSMQSLDNLDISKWRLAEGVNFTSFVGAGYSGLEHLNLSGLTFTNANLDSAFAYNLKLEDIDLDGFSATGITSAMFMFKNDIDLKSLDLTGFSIPSGVSITDMLSGLTSLTSLKVSNKTVLFGTGLVNSNGYKGWTDGTNNYSSDNLMSVYGNGTSSDESSRIDTTWTPIGTTEVDFTIEYVDSKTGKLVGTTKNVGTEGTWIYISDPYPGYGLKYPQYPGYDSVSTRFQLASFNDKFNTEPHTQTFTVNLTECSYVVTITESNGSKELSEPHTIQVAYNDGDGDSTRMKDTESDLLTGRTLDSDNTTVSFMRYGQIPFSGKLSSSALGGATLGQLFSYISGSGEVPADHKFTVEELILDAVTLSYLNNTNVTLGLIYLPISSDDKPASNPSSSGSGSSSSMVLKNQNIATATKTVKLYGADGKLVTNRALDINTAWKSDAEYNLNGVKYYRVSTDEYVKANDVYVYTDNVATVKVYDDQKGDLVDYLGADLDRKLGAGSEWKTDRIAHINGQEYYRVSTDEFLAVGEAFEY